MIEPKYVIGDIHSFSRDDFDKEITRLTQLRDDYRNQESALKIIINSAYGALGFKNFVAYHYEVAKSIAQQSSALLQFIQLKMNEYFKLHFHSDVQLLESIGVTIKYKIEEEVVIYCDTDSIFLNFGRILDSISVPENDKREPFDVIKLMLDKRLNGYISHCLTKFCEMYNAYTQKFDGSPSFKLVFEQYCDSIIWTAAKHYIKHVTWKKGVKFDKLKKVDYKGIATNQSGYPKYIRSELKNIIKSILNDLGDGSGQIDTNRLLGQLREIRSKMPHLPPDEICMAEKASDYPKFVKNDQETIEIASGAKQHYTGAAVHNYLLRKSDFKEKYNFIGSGDKIKYYQILDAKDYEKAYGVSCFGFIQGMFPVEFAPPIDYDHQFEKMVLATVNSVLNALGFPKLDNSLVLITKNLF